MKIDNEIIKYHRILCDYNYPKFIDKYLDLNILKRIDDIGMLCGGDYTKIFEFKYWYSRLSHSISTSLMAWNFTHNKKDTLAALLHDIGTPCFSHCIDYLFGDGEHQSSSELDIFGIIDKSNELKSYLEEDKISIKDLKYPSTVVENEKPALCVDRLDGVFATGMVWLKKYDLNYVKNVYKNMVVLTNELGEEEIGFNSVESALKFFDISFDYSMILQSNRDKYLMQYIADALKKLIDSRKLTLKELYILKERDIIERLKENISSWDEFENTKEVISASEAPNQYYVSVGSKKRYVNPLCICNHEAKRLNEVSDYSNELLNEYFNFSEKKYSYVRKIKEV